MTAALNEQQRKDWEEYAYPHRSATGDGAVQVAYLHPNEVSHSWHECMTRMLLYDLSADRRMVGTNGPLAYRSHSDRLDESRNLVVASFLDRTPHEWLFWIDTDMGFPPDGLDRLLNVADPVDRPIIGGLCFGAREVRSDGLGGFRIVVVPTIYVVGNTGDSIGFTPKLDYVPNAVQQCAGTGSAFILIHRSVLERMREKFGDNWYTKVRYEDGRAVSEDLSFCYRATMLDIRIFVDASTRTTHHKQVWLSEADYTPPAEMPRADPSQLPEGVSLDDEPIAADEDHEPAA